MSHDATNWAIKQRGLKPSAKVVLWHLCDRYHPDNGCFPSQVTLAHDCELSRSALNDVLAILEKAGLIAREQRRHERSNKQLSTFYRFAFERDFQPVPSPEIGHGFGDGSVSGNDGEPSPENGESRVRIPDSNLVREPVREPVNEREARKRENSGFDGSGQIGVVNADLTKRVQKFVNGDGYREGEWKKWTSSTIAHIAKQFAALTAEEQDRACEWRDAFLAKCKRDGVSKPMPVANYFRDKVWEMLTDADKAVVRPVAGGPPAVTGGKIVVPVFGPAYAAAEAWALVNGPVYFELPDDLRDRVTASYHVHARRGPYAASTYLQRLGLEERDGELVFPRDFEAQERARRTIEEGYPEVKRLHEAAKDRTHVTVAPIFELLKGLCEAVPVGSATFEQWRDHYHAQTWPVGPMPHVQKVMFFPKGGPEGLEEFERAARSLMQARDNDDAA